VSPLIEKPLQSRRILLAPIMRPSPSLQGPMSDVKLAGLESVDPQDMWEAEEGEAVPLFSPLANVSVAA
jgi:hypothetical protein